MPQTPSMGDKRKTRVAFVSSYPPRECGIANFTRDLAEAIRRGHRSWSSVVVAINEKGASYNYGRQVKFQIQRDFVESYLDAARYINQFKIDLVSLQHEFGLFGGEWGEHIISLIKDLQKPVVTTLHTILQSPPPKVKKILGKLAHHSVSLVVMCGRAMEVLEEAYGIPPEKIRIIPHGCPDIPFVHSGKPKASLGLKDRVVLSTFGLISRGKGIQYAIRALPPIVKMEPRILYLVIGETHPEVRKIEGESYRKELMSLVEELRLEKHVKFHNRYLKRSELIRYLQATDIYISPYVDRSQTTSGTLVYALGTGKAIISTPYLHAEEALSNERGLMCKFRDPVSITTCIENLLKDDELRRTLEKRAYEHGREMTWPRVATRYLELFHQTIKG